MQSIPSKERILISLSTHSASLRRESSFMCSSVAAPTLALWLRAVALTSLHAVAAGAASAGVRILVALMKTREKRAEDVLLYNRLSPTSAMPSNQRFGRPGMYEFWPR